MASRTTNQDSGTIHWSGSRRCRSILSLWRPVLNWAVMAGLLVQATGCTRPFYRKKADEEVSEVLAQKDKYPDWKIDDWHVYPDPRARFADTSDPDHPPKPPDDPAAYDLSPNPQKPGHAGIERVEGTGYLELIAKWDRENRERKAQEDADANRSTAEPQEAEEQAAARRKGFGWEWRKRGQKRNWIRSSPRKKRAR
jgi:hypothetical protein